MKKIYLAFAFLLFVTISSRAASVTIDVEDFEFDPAVVIVSVGDTIFWVWDEGFHTVTSTLLPAGASSFDYAVDDTHPIAFYIPTVSGSYDYQCNYHASMNMIGHITVTGSTGVTEVSNSAFRLRSNYVSDFLFLEQEASGKNIAPVIRDLTGRVAKRFDQSVSGSDIEFYVGDLKNGVYIFQMSEVDKYSNYRFIKY